MGFARLSSIRSLFVAYVISLNVGLFFGLVFIPLVSIYVYGVDLAPRGTQKRQKAEEHEVEGSGARLRRNSKMERMEQMEQKQKKEKVLVAASKVPIHMVGTCCRPNAKQLEELLEKSLTNSMLLKILELHPLSLARSSKKLRIWWVENELSAQSRIVIPKRSLDTGLAQVQDPVTAAYVLVPEIFKVAPVQVQSWGQPILKAPNCAWFKDIQNAVPFPRFKDRRGP